MRIAIMGTGGLGGFCGALLARAGNDVTFIARGGHLEAIQARGLTVKSPMVGDFTVSAKATSDPRDVGPVDLVILGVKMYDLDAAALQMKPLIGADTVILPVQNGLDASQRIDRAVGAGHALVGVAYISSLIESPGVIKHATRNTVLLGEQDDGPTPRVQKIADVLNKAGISCQTPQDINVPLWEKFILLAGTGGVMALTRLFLAPIRENAEASAFFRGALSEALAVGRASGVPLDEDLVDRHWEMLLGLPGETHGSMLEDLNRGRRLEIDALNGTVVRLGRELGVPTPLNFAIYAGLKPYADGPPAAQS